MIDPDDYWVNNPLISPMNKAMIYDMDIWKAEQNEQDRVIDLLKEYTSHRGKTHYQGGKCFTCEFIAIVKGEK